ncbi:MAG: septum formation initiator family protein [Rhodococcus sp.]|nr:septum formation initiator family protein [Rhodococcus sp. (in: high G+C Gram-positive bacteria)]
MAQRRTPRSSGNPPGGRGAARSKRKPDSAPSDRRPSRGGPRASSVASENKSVRPGGRGRTAKASNRAEHTILGLSTGKALVLAMVVLGLALTLAMPLRTYLTQRAEAERLAAEQVQLEKDIADLTILREQYTDPAYIEAQARERLRFVKPGDTPYQVQLPGDYQEPEKAEDADDIHTGPWYSDLWKSVSVPESEKEPPPPPRMPVMEEEPGEPVG